jgi:predicted TIM-barrel fold metal-dependent hydrolase
MYNGHKVLDVHGHLSTPPQFQAHGFGIINNSPGIHTQPRVAGTSQQSRSAANSYKIPEEPMRAAQQRHIEYIDERNIDIQLLSPRPLAMMQWMWPLHTALWCYATNDAIFQACQMNPGRFFGVGQLPLHSTMPDTRNCLEEAEYVIKEYGFVGLIVNPDPGGERTTPGMNDEWWYPLYEKAEELGAGIFVHGSCSRDPRTTDNQFSFMVEEALATHVLERSEVFDRFPALRICISHCGGGPSRFVTNNTSAAWLPDNKTPDGLYFDTCAYHRGYIELCFQQRGVDRFCFGTEAPGSGNAINPETGKQSDDMLPVFDMMKSVSDAEKKMVLFDSPLKAFPLLQKAAREALAAPA